MSVGFYAGCVNTIRASTSVQVANDIVYFMRCGKKSEAELWQSRKGKMTVSVENDVSAKKSSY